MHSELSDLICRLDNPKFSETSVIPWGCPVPSFGDLSGSRVATVGLNPSNREFVDSFGNELQGDNRRFPTLGSLGLKDWSEAEEEHLNSILELCSSYFYRNPYDGWFKRLDYLISGTNTSFYDQVEKACHLDLIPYATACKWTELSTSQRSLLLELTGDILGLLLRDSEIELLVLNGKTVVDNFQKVSNTTFKCTEIKDWELPRKSNKNVSGFAFQGSVKTFGGVRLKRDIHVIGYNHNIQSSFGVTKQVQKAIRNWVSRVAKGILG